VSDELYRRDPLQPTSWDVERDLDRQTDSWVFKELGRTDLDPDEWPKMSDGRTHGEVSLQAAGIEFGVPVELGDRPPLPKPPEGPLCSNCGLAPVRNKRTGLCNRCRVALETTGHLPTRRSNWFHRRRFGRR